MLGQDLMAENYNRLRYYGYFFKSPSYLMTSAKGYFLSRLPKLGVQKAFVHSCISWVHEDQDFHTRVYLFNYWTESYGLSDVIMDFALHDSEGRRIHSWKARMQPQETKCVDLQAVIRELGIEIPFEGTLIARTQNLARRHWVPLRANVDYYGESFATTVHDHGWLMSYRRRETHSLVPVVDNDLFETSLVLMNCFDYRRDPGEFVSRPCLEVFGPKGERLAQTTLAPLKGCGARRVALGEAIPSLRKMLGGQVGGLRLSAINPGRPLFFIKEKKSGRYWVDHASNDRAVPRRIMSRKMLGISGDGAEVTTLALEENDLHTRYTLINNLGFSFDYDLRLCLFGTNGEKVLDVPRMMRWQPYETKVIYLKELLQGCGVSDGFLGHIRVSLLKNGRHAIYPIYFDVIAELFNRESAQGVVLGSSLSNSGVRRKYLFEPPSTRIFSRVITNREYRTSVHVINTSARLDYQREANPELTLFDGGGSHSMETKIRIPPHGSVLFDVDQIFPSAREFLEKSDGIGQIRIRDRDVRLDATHLLAPRSGGVPAIDHFFGG